MARGAPGASGAVAAAALRALSAVRVAVRLGSAHSPVPVIQNTRADRTASRSSSSGWISRSGALGCR